MLMTARRERPRVYGYLYNWFVVNNIASTGWRTGSRADWINLSLTVGGEYFQGAFLYAGGYLKSVRTSPIAHPRWTTPNTGAVDTFNIGLLGGGSRYVTKELEVYFASLGGQGTHQTATEISATNCYVANAAYSNDSFSVSGSATGENSGKKIGRSIRLCRELTIVEQESYIPDGTYMPDYVGNDGKKYKAVKIGSLVWLAENLQETKYNNGTDIPLVTDATEWSNLTTGARCAYNNDMSYV
jgi:hypothetical protein